MTESHHPATHVRKPFFRRDPLVTILATVVIYFLSQIIAAVIISLYPLFKNYTEQQAGDWLVGSPVAQFLYIVIAEIIAVSMVYYLLNWAHVMWSRIGWVKPRLKHLGQALLAYGAYFIVYLLVMIAARVFIPSLDVDQEQQIGFESAISLFDLVLAFISLVILPPIAEEIIFRGFLFTSLRAKYRFRYAAIATSILFGIAHLQFGAGAPPLWVAAIDTFVLSMFLCYVRERSGALWPAIYLHAIKNFIAFMVLFGGRI